jgi:hypothetical protein
MQGDEPRYIIWDPRDGEPRTDGDGEITSDGVIGRIGRDNVYLRGYAKYADGTEYGPDGAPVLEPGQFAVAEFGLSGSKGTYRVYRVR